MVFPDSCLRPWLTARAAIALGWLARGLPARDAVAQTARSTAAMGLARFAGG